MNKKLMFAGLSALTLGSLAIGANQVFAYRGDPMVKGPNYSEERHTAMTEAFANKDYNAWKNLMAGHGRVSQVVNEGNFAKFTEAHQLMLAGKLEEANQIRAELGLNQRNGTSGGFGNGYRGNR